MIMSSDTISRVKPTIRMVAERAQLSPTTVSLALRGAKSIPLETRERVLEAANELNYVYSPRTRIAAQADIRYLVFVMPEVDNQPITTNPFYGEVLSGAEQACTAQNASLTFTVLSHREKTPPFPGALLNTWLDGILLVGPYTQSLIEHLSNESGKTIVLVDNWTIGLPYDSVMADDFGGAYVATKHLLTLGHRFIGALVGWIDTPSFAERYRGYCAACQDAGVKPQPAIEMGWDRGDISLSVQQLLSNEPRLTALFCVADHYAVMAMEALRDLNIPIPDKMSVVGFDNEPIAHLAHPPLTTLNNHPRILGRLGVQRLLARIEGNDDPPQRITIGTELIVRESTQAI